jgi:hypothetical protein
VKRTRVGWPILGLALGLMLAQLAWVVAVPPYRGLDEWDHAYRAAAVAEGQWVAEPTAATRGTGAVVRVPDHIVEAARPECERLPYTGDPECVGRPTGTGYVEVASGAGRYHPAFYALVGYPALPFDGVAALYAMRVAGAIACLLMMLLAVACVRRWAEGSPAPFLALAVAITPSVLYASVIAAPNGLEMVAGLAWASALIGLGVTRLRQHERLYLTAAAIAGSVLVTTRSLGPLWCALTLATCLIALPISRRRVREIVTSRAGMVSIAVVATSALASVAWTKSQASLMLGTKPELEGHSLAEKVALIAQGVLQWPLQSIGAFPYRDQPAPALLYATYGTLLIALLVLGLRSFERRGRVALSLGLVTLFVLPAAVTYATADQFGSAWQGRYELPYAVGLLLLAGAACQRSGIKVGPRVVLPGLVLFVIGQLVGPVHVLRQELAKSPYAGTDLWSPPPIAVLGLLVALAAAFVWLGASGTALRRRDPTSESTAEELTHAT